MTNQLLMVEDSVEPMGDSPFTGTFLPFLQKESIPESLPVVHSEQPLRNALEHSAVAEALVTLIAQ